MCMSGLLRNSKSLRTVLMQSAQIILPPILQQHFLGQLDSCCKVMPSKSTVSRWRVVLDAAFMLSERHSRAEESAADSRGYARYMMADSSMRHGRDLEHIVFRSIALDNITRMFDSANTMINARLLGFPNGCLGKGLWPSTDVGSS